MEELTISTIPARTTQFQKLDDLILQDKKVFVTKTVNPKNVDLTLGHLLPFYILEELRLKGAKPIIVFNDIISNFQNSTDSGLIKRYIEQISRFLPLENYEIHSNAEWNKTLTLSEIIETINGNTSLQFGRKGNLFDEVYGFIPIIDALKTDTDIILTANDVISTVHTFRKIRKYLMNKDANGIIFEPLVGTNGKQKMDRRLHNEILISLNSFDFFGRIMSVSDETMISYYQAFGFNNSNTIYQPLDAKLKLAYTITKIFYSKDEAIESYSRFKREVMQKNLPDEITTYSHEPGQLVELAFSTGLYKSKSEIRRQIKQNGFRIDGLRVENISYMLETERSYLVQNGKKTYILEILSK